MKKFLFSLAVLGALILFFSPVASGAPSVSVVDGNGVSLDDRGWLTYEVDGTFPGTSVISASTIIPGTHKILGYQIVPISANCDMRVELYDDNAAAVAHNIVLNELEKTATSYDPEWFPHPRKLLYGLVVKHYGGTKILIFYTP